MKAMVEHYMSGAPEWNRPRTAGGGGGRDTTGIVLQAMARVWPDRDAEAMVGQLAEKRGIDRKAALKMFADTREVTAAMAAIRAERATVDADELLGELDAGGED